MKQQSTEASPDYFRAFDHIVPPKMEALSRPRAMLWQFLASLTLGLGVWYLHWRWTSSLNEEALIFSVIVASAETAMFLGTLLFFFDIWDEGDTPRQPAPSSPEEAHLPEGEELTVDIFVATYDEDPLVLEATLEDAKKLRIPEGWHVRIYLLDDGNRPAVKTLAEREGVSYIARSQNLGFKAGNMRNALFQTDGAFIVVCDADTRLLPGYLENTLGYFRDPEVAWVQTPHWFYDIPTGRPWSSKLPAPLARIAALVTGHDRSGRDPYLSGSLMFFDVIQRRRNRNGASFCCGAGSIHRREPIFKDALAQHQRDRVSSPFGGQRSLAARLFPLQPFRFHVSEDIYTSMLLHGSEKPWKSVYHPDIESKMLSPWSMDAWASQKLKYAGGTLDIMLRANPLANSAMPWRTRLHYAATFWSYLSALVLVTLLAAPIFTLLTGLAPVDAYSATFFLHLLPLLISNEAALAVAAKGQDANQGRILSLATLPIVLRAFWLTGWGKRIRFRPTPKTPMFQGSLRFVTPHIALLAIMAAAMTYGVVMHLLGSEEHSMPLLIVNAFWLGWCGLSIASALAAALWRPLSDDLAGPSVAAATVTKNKDLSHA